MILDSLDKFELYLKINTHFKKAFKYLKEIQLDNFEFGKKIIEQDYVFAINNEYDTKNKEGSYLEGHKKYIDIQYMVEGEELIGYSSLADQKVQTEYKRDTDLIFFSDPSETFIKLKKGMFAIFYPEDLHMPGIMTDKPQTIKKVVIKVKI